MADGQKRSEWAETLIGLAVILIGVAAIVGAGYFFYSKFSKSSPDLVSLSAYFVDQSGTPVNADSSNYEQSHLKIRGDVYYADQPVKSGNVRLTLRTGDESFRQSISIPLKDGHFETEDPAFFSIRPGVQIQITADISSSQPSLMVSDHIDLNSAHTSNKLVLEIALTAGFLLLTIPFFYSFTGKKTHLKNRTAISFSYVIIGVFLAVPILAPVLLLHAFPGAVDAMIGAPAGLVNTHTAIQEPNQSEWALNIGGYSYKLPAAIPPSPGNTPPTGADAASNTTTIQGATPPATGTAQKPGTNKSGNPVQVSQPATNAQSASIGTTSADSLATAAPSRKSARHGPFDPVVVGVQGGLVIPLYVIILSVIGGAINMTRKVPGLQKEGEESDFSIVRPISSLGTAVMEKLTSRSGEVAKRAPLTATDGAPAPADGSPAPADGKEKKSELSPENQATAIDAEIDRKVVTQVLSNCVTEANVTDIRLLVLKMQELFKSKTPDERLLKFNSFEDWFGSHPRLREVLGSNWRVELLNQYMYLISAPFLAIVTYYIIDLLGLTKLGQGVLVVLSFSVGLISEKIVTWILGIASGYLRTDSNSNPAKAS